MTATSDSGNGNGSKGSPQGTLEELGYGDKVNKNEAKNSEKPPKYAPSPKHKKGGWGSENPIKSQEEGQNLLDTGYKDGKQIYNVTSEGKIVKFQPDNTPENGYHAYEVKKSDDISAKVLKAMYKDGKISKSQYNKLRKGKGK